MNTHFSPTDMQSLLNAYSGMDADQLRAAKHAIEELPVNPLLVKRHEFLLSLIENLIEWRISLAPWIPNITVR